MGAGIFVELVDAIPVSSLPKLIPEYVAVHYKTPIKEAGKLKDAQGREFYEVEIKGKDLIFDLNGQFIKED